jgi:hypothetical protein
MKRTIGARAIGRGLAKVEPASPNTLIAFAAKAGSTASDGDSTNSPFTAALVRYLTKPGLDLRKALGFAGDDVLKATKNRQEPFIYGSLGGNDVALVPAHSEPPGPVDVNTAARRDYELALQIGKIAIWNSFISSYPSGFYADLAKAQRDKLVAEIKNDEKFVTQLPVVTPRGQGDETTIKRVVVDPHATVHELKKEQDCPKGTRLGLDGSCLQKAKSEAALVPAKKMTRRSEGDAQKGQEAGTCARMKNRLSCECAMKTGGYIYRNPGSYSGYSFRWYNSSAHSMCLYAAGQR